MKNKTTVVVCSGMAAAGVLASAMAVAAPQSISDNKLDQITGKSNTYTFGSTTTNTTTTLTQGPDSSANIQFGWYQWSDLHGTDGSLHKGANDQSGTSSNVQGTVVATVNSLVWGSVGQNSLINAPGTFTPASQTVGTATGSITGNQSNMAYGVFAGGGF